MSDPADAAGSDVRIVASWFLRGPNIHARRPCVVAVVDLGGLDGVTSAQVPGFTERLCELVPTLAGHRCSPRRPGGFVERLRDGTLMGHVIEHVAIELQCLAGTPVGFGRTRRVRGEPHRYRVVCAYRLEAVAAEALALAVRLVAALARRLPYDLGAPLAALRATAAAHAIDAASQAVLDVARRRGIPVWRPDETRRVFQLGWGRRQRRLDPETAATATSAGAARAVVDALFAPGDDGRIPVVAITGTNGKTTTTLLIAHALRLAGRRTGTTTTQGVWIGDRMVEHGDCTGYWSAKTVLGSAEVDAAVLETARGGLLKRGLAFDRCDVGVVLNVAGDHLGLDGVETLADLARVKGLVARCARSAAVLNADDPRCVAMARRLAPGCRAVYFSTAAANPVLQSHLQGGGRAAWLDEGRLVLGEGGRRRPLLHAERMPAALGGHALYNVANGLAAAAALACLGVDDASIAAALASFVSDARQNPLRSNRFDVNGVTVIVDYAHNVVAYRALCTTARSMLGGGAARLLGVVTAPGDRRAADLFEIGQACGAGFDELVVYEHDPRGRSPGATVEAILAGARTAAAGARLHGEPHIRDALARGLGLARSGDIVVFTCAGTLDDVVEGVRRFDPAAGGRIARELAG